MKLGELRKLSQAIQNNGAEDIQTFVQEYIRALGMDPDALYQELEMTSRYVDTHWDSSASNAHIQLHSHTFYELLYCCNSCGAEYLVGTERYRLQQGDVVLVPPGVSHRPLLPEPMEAPYDRYVLWLSPEFMEGYAALFFDPFVGRQVRTSMLRTQGTRWEYLGDLFRKGVREAERQKEGWEAAVVGNTITLLTQIKRALSDASTGLMAAEKPELLDRIMAYVEENYAEPINISVLAKHFFVSSSTVSHLFQQKMNVSFYRYVTQRRLIAAKTLISQGENLQDVAVNTGFQDYSGFYRAFKQAFGISPRQYRSLQENANTLLIK